MLKNYKSEAIYFSLATNLFLSYKFRLWNSLSVYSGMSEPGSEVGKLESAALARKERLAKLRAAKNNKSGENEEKKSELPK